MVVLYFDDRALRVRDLVVEDCVCFHRDVVFGDAILVGYVYGYDTYVDPIPRLQDRYDESEARIHESLVASEEEEHASFVLVYDFESDEQYEDDGSEYEPAYHASP